jgi:peptide/nickel transport system permease protein
MARAQAERVEWKPDARAGRRLGVLTLLRRMVRRRRVIGIGALILFLILAAAAAASLLAPYDPLALDIPARLRPPGPAHLFGTDDFGRDIFSRVVFGARLSLMVGILVTVVATAAGVVIGLIAGSSPRADRVLMRVMDGLMAFPDILLAIALMATLGPSVRNVVIALGFVYTPRVARVVRASVLVIVNLDYVEAARAVGASRARVLGRHILANCISPVIVQATFIAAYAMLGEAALSFLGVGVPPQVPTWGGIIASGQVYLRQAAWISIFPGAAIVLSVLALNLLGDGLRDFLDPKLRYSS